MTQKVDTVFFADCAARSFFDQVANKWSVMILTILEEKPTRFNELMLFLYIKNYLVAYHSLIHANAQCPISPRLRQTAA